MSSGKDEIRRRVIGSLSRAQVFEVSKEGEVVIEAEADGIMQLIAASNQQAVQTALIDELKSLIQKYSEQHKTKQAVIAVHDNIPSGSTLAMVPVVHINDRLAALAAAQARKDERGAEDD